MDFKNKTALVCGCTSGIGKSIAIKFAGAGANVVLFARDELKLKSTMQLLPVNGRQHHQCLTGDFNYPDQIKNTIKKFMDKENIIHILVNNSGGPPAGPILNATDREFSETFTRHLLCNHHLTQAVVPGMKYKNFGRIINIISTSVKEPIPGLGVSNTIRGAVANWAKTLSLELAPFKITVNNILPGATNTPRLSALFKNKASSTRSSVEDITSHHLKSIPMGRFAEPDEIAYAVLFLASEEAGYITGINLPVDGGRTSSL